jgi:hypothetical protein
MFVRTGTDRNWMTVGIPGYVPASAERLGAVALDVNVAPGQGRFVEMVVFPKRVDCGSSVFRIVILVMS